MKGVLPLAKRASRLTSLYRFIIAMFIGVVIGSIVTLHMAASDSRIDYSGRYRNKHARRWDSSTQRSTEELQSTVVAPFESELKISMPINAELNRPVVNEDSDAILHFVSIDSEGQRYPLTRSLTDKLSLIQSAASKNLDHVIVTLLNETKYKSHPRMDFRDIHAMYLNLTCSHDESLEADTTVATSDCGLLDKEFGMCHAFKAKNISDHRTFEDLDRVKTPFAQGYITVPGLEDPLTVAAAIYDELHRIDKGEPIQYPLGAMSAAFVNGDEATGRAHQPFVFDLIYTEVDFMEPSFQGDRKMYKRTYPRPPPKLDMKASAVKRRREAQARQVEKAEALLPYFWANIAQGRLGADLTLSNDSINGFGHQGAELAESLEHKHADAIAAMMNRGLMNSGLPVLPLGDTNISTSKRLQMADPYAHLPRVLYAEFRGNADNVRRFRNFNELRYSLRSVYRYIIGPMEAAKMRADRAAQGNESIESTTPPKEIGGSTLARDSFGNIYVVVSHKSQAPPWLKGDRRIILVEHRDLFPAPSRSLPNFQSRAIESVLHRIRGLHRHYIGLNNDFMFGRQVSFFDYFQPQVVWVPRSTSENGTQNDGDLNSTDMSSSVDKPVVKWLPIIHTTEMYFTQPRSGRWKDYFSPSSLNMINFVAAMTGPDPLGFIFEDTHIPHMYDKLVMGRMLIEPSLRERLCFTRGSRERKLLAVPPFHTYQHFTYLWRHGWGPDAVRRATYELFPFSYHKYPTTRPGPMAPFTDSLGRRRTALWNYLKAVADGADGGAPDADDQFGFPVTSSAPSPILSSLQFLFHTLPKILNTGKPSVLMLPARLSQNGSAESINATVWSHTKPSFGSHAVAYDHWVFDVYRLLRQPALTLVTSNKVFFGMGENAAAISEHIRTIQRNKGKTLFITENDDLPGGSRLPSSAGIFRNMSRMTIAEICGWKREVWAAAACSRKLSVRADALASRGTTIEINSLSQVQTRVKNVGLTEKRVLDYLFGPQPLPAKKKRGALRVETTGDEQLKGDITAVCELVSERIGLACASEAAASAVEAMEVAANLREQDPAAGLETASKPSSCAIGDRFQSAGLRSTRSADFIQDYSHHKMPRLDFQATHNCSQVPLPDHEVPPSYDVYAADLLLTAIRTAAGDCDNSQTAPRAAPWEHQGC